jgi:hypothetical protein
MPACPTTQWPARVPNGLCHMDTRAGPAGVVALMRGGLECLAGCVRHRWLRSTVEFVGMEFCK